MQNGLSKKILQIIESAGEPLETKEVEGKLKEFSRTMILYRLNNLRGDGLIKGKRVGPGKGVWIWWKR
jgi:DNA-binding Lrp family transcriptional regulator